jgi:hypothetical protein
MIDLTWIDPESVPNFCRIEEEKDNRLGRMNGIGSQAFIARSHQLVQAGWEWMHNNRLVIVSSALNYYCTPGNDPKYVESTLNAGSFLDVNHTIL